MQTLLRRLKGAAFNAVFWGVVWFGVGFLFYGAIRLAAGGFLGDGSFYLRRAIFEATGTGLVGAGVGGLFSLFVAANFRHREVDELNPWRFAFGGALVTAVVALGVFYVAGADQLVDTAIVDPAGLYRDMLTSMLIVGGIGGSTAFASIKLAQRAPRERLEAGSPDLISS